MISRFHFKIQTSSFFLFLMGDLAPGVYSHWLELSGAAYYRQGLLFFASIPTSIVHKACSSHLLRNHCSKCSLMIPEI